MDLTHGQGTDRVSQVVLVLKNPPANAGDMRARGSIPGLGEPLEESIATHSSILAWRIPWIEEPSTLQPMGNLARTAYREIRCHMA